MPGTWRPKRVANRLTDGCGRAPTLPRIEGTQPGSNRSEKDPDEKSAFTADPGETAQQTPRTSGSPHSPPRLSALHGVVRAGPEPEVRTRNFRADPVSHIDIHVATISLPQCMIQLHLPGAGDGLSLGSRWVVARANAGPPGHMPRDREPKLGVETGGLDGARDPQNAPD